MTASTTAPRFLPAGDTALVVEFGDAVDRAISDRVLALTATVEACAVPGIVELVPTFRSLMIHYDPVQLRHGELAATIRSLLGQMQTVELGARLWTLPVCYGFEFGPDLEDVAERTGHTPDEVIRLHTAETYHVYALGFLPGYPYMGGVTPALSLPRRETPRVRVPMGSVCIALEMAGIYSLESPGGWHLLGRTPVRLFDTRREAAVLLAPGDKVRFEAVDQPAFDALEAEAVAGLLEVHPQVLASAPATSATGSGQVAS